MMQTWKQFKFILKNNFGIAGNITPKFSAFQKIVHCLSSLNIIRTSELNNNRLADIRRLSHDICAKKLYKDNRERTLLEAMNGLNMVMMKIC